MIRNASTVLGVMSEKISPHKNYDYRELYRTDTGEWRLTYPQGLEDKSVSPTVVKELCDAGLLFRSASGTDCLLTHVPKTFSHMSGKKAVFTRKPEAPQV